jgi:hypothetical protein
MQRLQLAKERNWIYPEKMKKKVIKKKEKK